MKAKDLSKLDGGARVLIPDGIVKGVWLKLRGEGEIALINSWVNIETGTVRHFSWLIGEKTELIKGN